MQVVRGTIKKNMIAGLLVTVPVAFTYIILDVKVAKAITEKLAGKKETKPKKQP